MIACGVIVCALARLGETDPVTLACTGKAFAYTPDLSRQVEVREPFEFRVAVSLSLGRLTGAHIVDAHDFELRDAGDAVFFFRDRPIAGRTAFEWISISRISGNYAHFIAFRDAVSGGLESSVLMASASCRQAT
jgi:hypothetical protein